MVGRAARGLSIDRAYSALTIKYTLIRVTEERYFHGSLDSTRLHQVSDGIDLERIIPTAAEPNSTTPIDPLPSRIDWGFRASRQLAAQLAYFRLDEWLLSAMSLVLHKIRA